MSKKTRRRRRDSVVKETIERKENFKYKLILEGVGVGLLVGLVVGLFRYCLQEAEAVRNIYIAAASKNVLLSLLGVVMVIFLATVVIFCLKREPLCGGSGIPQVKGEMRGEINANWLQVIIAKFIGGVAAIGGGLSLGREGPSIQLGAMVGKGFSRLNNRLRTEEKMLISCGSGAGLAAAFGAPLAGVVFVLEEIHKTFSKELLLSTMAAAISGDFIASYMFGLEPVFDFQQSGVLPLTRYWMVLILGIILGAFGVFYNKTIEISQNLYGLIKIKWLKAAIPVSAVLILTFVFPYGLGSGHGIVGDVGSGNFSIKYLIVILIVKYIFSALSFGTGSPGGIFLPLLVLGAVSGGLFSEIMGKAFGFEDFYVEYFVILGMAGYFSAIVRAPITGIILISEMTGNLSNLLSISMVSLAAYITAEILKGRPIYDQLLDRMLSAATVKKPRKNNKVLLESQVFIGSLAEGKTLEELGLPRGALVVSIVRNEKEMVPGGQTVLACDDRLIVLCNEEIAAQIEDKLNNMCKTIRI